MIRMVLVGIAFVVGIAIGYRSIVWAGCFWIWNDIFRPVYWARGVGFLSAGWFKSVYICTAVLVFAVFFTRWPRRWNFGAGALTFLVIWVWISKSQAQIEDIALAKAIEVSKYMIPLIPISIALCYRRSQEIFLYALAGSVGIWLVHYGVITVLSGRPLILMAIPGGQMTDRNDFMVAGVACIPLLVYMGWHYRGWYQRWVRWGTRVGSIFAVGAVFYSLSRGAMLGLGLLGLWWAVATTKPFRKIAIGILVLVIAIPFVPQATWERMQTIELQGEQTESSALNRTFMMRTAVTVTLDYPVFGCGPNCFPTVSTNYQPFTLEPHSLWLKCSSEYGVTMLLVFLFVCGRLLIGLFKTAREARVSGDRETAALATALSCALIGFLGTGSFTSQFLSQYLWSIIALSGAFLSKPYWKTAEEAWQAQARVPRGETALRDEVEHSSSL